MELLNKIVAYWYDCIKNEDILEKNISINVRKKAVLYPFNEDPFIFNLENNQINVSGDEKLENFSEYIKTEEFDSYYGYPLLFYFDANLEKHMVAPLFVIEVKFARKDGDLYLQKAEQLPNSGIQAFKKLGLHTEEIAEINRDLENLLRSKISDSSSLAEKCLEKVQKEIEIKVNEPIIPNQLTNSTRISKNMTFGLYNKSMIYADEKTAFNIYLLQDLLELKEKNDLSKTALSFIVNEVSSKAVKEQNKKSPILAFPANEYQIASMQDIFYNDLTVITGPPGTGKSQFISNLLINLFMKGKTALLVSHTNPAVRVVDDKINSCFENLMIRTGSIEYRQELTGKLNDLIYKSSKSSSSEIDREHLENMWQQINRYKKKILEIQELEKKIDNKFINYNNQKNLFSGGFPLEKSFRKIGKNLDEIKIIIKRILKLKEKYCEGRLPFWDKFILFFNSRYLENKKAGLFKKLTSLIPDIVLKILKKSKIPERIEDWNDPGWIRFSEYFELFKKYNNLKDLESRLKVYNPRLDIERGIRNLESNYYDLSKKYVKNKYLQEMVGNGKKVGKVKSYLTQINSNRIYKREGLDIDLFTETLDVLRVWSSTLKSVGRNFPLDPGIFDYVIFDEASQVDLPSAAPALYRAKKAVIVGDPMQLTHIAGITRDMDKVLAKKHDLTEDKNLYLSKTRYCDISLYKSAENSLLQKPIFLTKHYRSEDQIISLCNKVFYDERLKIMTTHDYSKYPESLPIGVRWINCKGSVYKHPSGSRINKEEAKAVNEVFQKILERISNTDLSIGVVTPYSRQQDEINKLIFNSISSKLREKHAIRVLTAHKFQGTEKDIMIFSLVLASRGDGNSDRWYNIYPQILNVALSRAKYFLCIVGDKKFCYSRSGILRKLVETYDDIKKQENVEKYSISGKFDTPFERFLFKKLQNLDFEKLGYKLVPKYVAKRYILDFALLGEKKKIDIECDGCQHEIIKGLPVIEDVERDDFLNKHGWKVLRFQNHKIIYEPDKVIKKILDYINGS